LVRVLVARVGAVPAGARALGPITAEPGARTDPAVLTDEARGST
jgi:hypothetical protein